tara:strand:+ start:8251 stop:9594 length:1344 start_codon:yes stop_codon:yes gene_type:complete
MPLHEMTSEISVNQDISITPDFITQDQVKFLENFCRNIKEWDRCEGIWDDRGVSAMTDKVPLTIQLAVHTLFRKIEYKIKEFYNLDEIYVDTIGFTRWRPGDKQSPHADGEEVDGSAHRNYPWRKFGCILYLNDDYEGGELYLPQYGIQMRPKPGTLAFFPGNAKYLHGVKPVQEGPIRYNIASFWTDKKEKRYRKFYDYKSEKPEVPAGHIAVLTEHPDHHKTLPDILHSFKGNVKRDWFVKHAYHCLPLVIGNQYGIGIRSMSEFRATWNGGPKQNDVVVEFEDKMHEHQKIEAHFGMGTVTIQNRFNFMTPPGVNLMTINPPNHWIDGVQHMTGVIETDNLRRDFTFNLKLTRPGHTVHVKKGEFIGCVIPIPRYFVDSFEWKVAEELFRTEDVWKGRKAKSDFGLERRFEDPDKPNRNGLRYRKGVDIYGNEFPDHQVSMKRK